MKAWTFDPDALGPLPAGVEVVDEPVSGVEFVVPTGAHLPDLRGLPDLRVIQVLFGWVSESACAHHRPRRAVRAHGRLKTPLATPVA